MIKAVLLKVKEGYINEWKDWCSELQHQRYGDAQSTLREEGLIQEGALLFERGNEYYVIGFTEGDGLGGDQGKEINKMHQEKKNRCLEYLGPVESLYHSVIS